MTVLLGEVRFSGGVFVNSAAMLAVFLPGCQTLFQQCFECRSFFAGENLHQFGRIGIRCDTMAKELTAAHDECNRFRVISFGVAVRMVAFVLYTEEITTFFAFERVQGAMILTAGAEFMFHIFILLIQYMLNYILFLSCESRYLYKNS